MNKLNINNWKYFTLGDNEYFKIIKIKNPLTLSNYKFSWTKTKFNHPIISSSGINNGTVNFVIENEKWLNKGNVITIANNGSVGETFYQNFDFLATNDVTVVDIVDYKMNSYIAMFLCTMIKQEKFRFNYGRKWSIERIKKTKIFLPSLGENIDWNWMENYSKKIFSKIKKNIIKLVDIENKQILFNN